jgi:cold shock CspA family protein
MVAAAGDARDERRGVMLRIKDGFGFIQQDCGEKDMFVMPASCKAFGGILPVLGTRLCYKVIEDTKTGRPRAEHVHPEAITENTSSHPKGRAVHPTRYGAMARKKDNSFGFIHQDNGEDDMFVMPNACDSFGGVLPAIGTRVSYLVVRDQRTGKPRAENVNAEGEGPFSNAGAETEGCAGSGEVNRWSLPNLLQSSTNHRVGRAASRADSRPWREPDTRITPSKKAIDSERTDSPLSFGAETDVPAESEYTPSSDVPAEETTLSPARRFTQRTEDTPKEADGDVHSAAAACRPRPFAARTRGEQLKRTVQSHLNKICPENIQTISARITSEAEVYNAEELELVISTVVRKALVELHYSETYADLVYHLAAALPEFPSSAASKPVTVKSILLNVCQTEYDDMPTRFQPGCEGFGSDASFDWLKLKARFLANMRFIGNLFLRQLVSVKLVMAILTDLLHMQDDNAPDEHVIECVCQLLLAIGHTLESMKIGKAFLIQVGARLQELKVATPKMKSSTSQRIYCKRVQFCIQDVLETRSAGWVKKTFKGLAQTKMEIKQKQEEDMNAGNQRERADTLIAGARPACLSED